MESCCCEASLGPTRGTHEDYSGAALTGVAVQVLLEYADSLLRQKSEEKLKKGGSPIFHQDSKTIVADHQQLSSALCAVAISSTHASQIVR